MRCPYKYINNRSDIFLDRLAFGSIDGICTKINGKYYIGIREGLSPIEERMVLAHELGHIIYGTTHITEDEEVENQADRFARKFLIPKKRLHRIIRRKKSIKYLSEYFNVSIEMMIVRIHELFPIIVSYEN